MLGFLTTLYTSIFRKIESRIKKNVNYIYDYS